MNKVILIGNLSRDPELVTTGSGVNYCRFGIAVQRRFANANGEREADFINCVAWRQTADFIEKYFKKGNKIAIVGSIQTRSYDDQDGNKKYATEVSVDEVEFVGSKNGGSDSGEPTGKSKFDDEPKQNNGSKIAKFEPIDDDDLPF